MIKFRAATKRNTKCYILDVGDLRLAISYTTIIAASDGWTKVRLANTWGPTTGRHFRDTATDNFKVVEEAEFDEFIKTTLFKISLKQLGDRMSAEEVATLEAA